MTIPAWVRVDAECVCIDDSPHTAHWGEKRLRKGAVYTLRNWVFVNNGWGVRLNEVVNEPRAYADGFVEAVYAIERFRPVKKTMAEDVAHIKALLEQGRHSPSTSPAPVEEGEHV